MRNKTWKKITSTVDVSNVKPPRDLTLVACERMLRDIFETDKGPSHLREMSLQAN